MSSKKSISDFSVDELKKLAKDAGLEARQESLDAGIEIMSQDEDGNLIYERKNEQGEIVTRPAAKINSNCRSKRFR